MKKASFAVAALGLMLAGSQVFAPTASAQDKGGKGGGAGSAAKGMEVFDSNCSVCHNSDSTEVKVGPGLKGLFKRATLNNKKKVSEASVREMINMGGNGMPPYGDMITETEKTDVIAFLRRPYSFSRRFLPKRHHRLVGLGHRPFTAVTRVRIPLGTPIFSPR